MESADLTILYSSDAAEWNQYLVWCFQELQPSTINNGHDEQQQQQQQSPHRRKSSKLHVRQQCIESLALPLTIAKIGFFRRAKVQIVILSPEFLEFVVHHPNVILGRLFEPSRVLALMCGVSESEVTSLHRASLASFDAWKKMTVVENDQEFIMRLIKAALEMIQANDKQCSVEHPEKPTSKLFRLNPSKAREGCAKLTVELQNAMPEDQVASVTLETEDESIPVNATRCNPYTLKFVVPDRFFGVSQYVLVHVRCGVESLGTRPLKCESKMGELIRLLQTLLNPVEFMCQTLGLTSSKLEKLDHILVEKFRKNVPANGFFLYDFSEDIDKQKVEEEVPTLLHFAAKMGLRELCSALLECPRAAAVCQMRNVRGLNPADLAEIEGHSCLANMLENFTRLSETAGMYMYMKSVTESGCSVDYENLRSRFNDSMQSGEPLMFQDERHGADLPQQSDLETPGVMQADHQQGSSDIQNLDSTASGAIDSSLRSNVQFCSKGQQELLQLLEDFKREKYTMAEVELLFQNWQLRQNSQSFKEKQEQLKTMRQQYDRLQINCEQDGKKSFLDRLRTFFAPSVKKESSPASVKCCRVNVRSRSDDSVDAVPNLCASNGRRPCSNASNSSRSSSSLSNRSSTLSGLSVCSTTDSGAQSDIGDEQQPLQSDQASSLHQCSPKLLNKSIMTRMVDNLQYMHTTSSPSPTLPARNDSNRRHSPPPPSPLVSSLPRKKSSAGVAMVRAPRNSCRHRNPMPIPRCLPSLLTFKPLRSTVDQESPDYIVPGDDAEEVRDVGPFGLPARPPPPPVQPRSDSHCRSGLLNSPQRDGYLLMDNNGRCPLPTSSLTPITSEPEYYNVSYTTGGVYMDMSSPSRTASLDSSVGAQVPSALISSTGSPVRQRLDSLLPNRVYVNTSVQSVPERDSDRCDSVPDVPPPAPPIWRHRGVLPPPLPPRNSVLPKTK